MANHRSSRDLLGGGSIGLVVECRLFEVNGPCQSSWLTENAWSVAQILPYGSTCGGERVVQKRGEYEPGTRWIDCLVSGWTGCRLVGRPGHEGRRLRAGRRHRRRRH